MHFFVILVACRGDRVIFRRRSSNYAGYSRFSTQELAFIGWCEKAQKSRFFREIVGISARARFNGVCRARAADGGVSEKGV